MQRTPNIFSPEGTHRASKAFEVHEVRRLPVTMTPTARSAIGASSSQGRLLPQALSEAFGLLDSVASLALDVTEEESPHLRITVLPGDTTFTPVSLSLLVADLSVVREDRMPAFGALIAAQALVEQYQAATQSPQGGA